MAKNRIRACCKPSERKVVVLTTDRSNIKMPKIPLAVIGSSPSVRKAVRVIINPISRLVPTLMYEAVPFIRITLTRRGIMRNVFPQIFRYTIIANQDYADLTSVERVLYLQENIRICP